jgi:hypothetical protein
MNIVHALQERKVNWIVHNVSSNCMLKHVMEGETENRIGVTLRRERRCKQLLYDFKETRSSESNRVTWQTDSLDMVVVPSTGTSR